jgi:hypothetical protein
MAFKPNYGMQRNDRSRAAQARSEKNSERERRNPHNAKLGGQWRLTVHLTMKK